MRTSLKSLILVGAVSLAVGAPAAALGAEACPSEQLRAENNSTALPDCRAYELVSPSDKGGNRVGSLNNVYDKQVGTQTSLDGDAFMFATSGPLPGSTSARFEYKAVRTPSGWSTLHVTPYSAGGEAFTVTSWLAASDDLSQGVFINSLSDSAEQFFTGTDEITRRDLLPGGASALMNVGQQAGFLGAQFFGATPDLSHVVFTSTSALTPNAPPAATQSLYETTNGAPRLVSVLPDGTPDPTGAILGAPSSSAASTTRFNAISDDGSHLAFTSLTDGQVYVRVNGTDTVEASASHGPDATGAFPSRFVGATTTGSKVYFTSPGRLTPDAGTAANSGADLYEYDLATEQLTDLTVDTNPADTAGADVLGLAGMSDDGTSLYVVAEGVLAPGATPGMANIYLLRDGQITFVAAVSSQFEINIWLGGPGYASAVAEVTPDGRYLAFSSAVNLVPDAGSGQNVYVYDADAAGAKLRCSSCLPGGRANGGATVPGYDVELLSEHRARFLTDDGTVFFDSRSALVTQDTNGLSDVYEDDHGRIALISSGRGDGDDELVDVTPNGSDVFFLSSRQLVGQDTDQVYDAYDARVGGGFPAPVTPVPCSAEGCRPPSTPPTPSMVVGSITFQGTGDLVPGPVRASVSVSSLRVITGSSATLKLRVPAAGTISVSGAPVQHASRQTARSGTYSVRVSLTAAARRSLARHRTLKAFVTVTFTTTSGDHASRRLTLTFKRLKGGR